MTPNTQGWAVREALALLAGHPRLYERPRSRAKAQTRHPATLKRTMFMKYECKLGRAWTDPEGHGRAAAWCSGQSSRLGWGGGGGLHMCTPLVS